jgi:effector-binding domain-containing protein
MSYPCEIKKQASQPALAIRTRAAVQDLPQVLGRCYASVYGYLEQLGQPPAGPPYIAYFNMDMQNLDLDVGVPVAQELPGNGEIQPARLPGGKVATCLYTGPYDEMGQAYDTLLKFIEDNREQPAGGAYEIYLSDSASTPPEQLQTLILFPLA